MNSFNDALDQLKKVLEDDAGLTAFCRARWNRKQTVLRVYKRRQEMNPAEFPVILITRPSVAKSFLVGARDGVHTVNLYCGFRQDDKLKASRDFVDFEEAIDDALLANHTLNSAVTNTEPASSVNDEGLYHPDYFFVEEVKITHRR